jgi:hypothetical protein
MKKSMRANNLVTTIALVISLGWGVLLAWFVLHNTRANVWYDMDFSIWIICILYAFVHLFAGKIWSLGASALVNLLRQKTVYRLEPYWTENVQMIYASLWPLSVPVSVLIFLYLIFFGKKSRTV